MTEQDANTVYVVNASKSEADPKEPLPPVHECTLDGVMLLWLIVPNRPERGWEGTAERGIDARSGGVLRSVFKLREWSELGRGRHGESEEG